MNISQLIKELEKIKAEHGDIPVTFQEWTYDGDGDWVSFSGARVVTDMCWDYKDPNTSYVSRPHIRLYE